MENASTRPYGPRSLTVTLTRVLYEKTERRKGKERGNDDPTEK